jgi:hypothetical protein
MRKNKNKEILPKKMEKKRLLVFVFIFLLIIVPVSAATFLNIIDNLD